MDYGMYDYDSDGNYPESYDVYEMAGGVRCSICQSEGTNKTTCPLNPEAVAAGRANPEKHPNAAKLRQTVTKSVTVEKAKPDFKPVEPKATQIRTTESKTTEPAKPDTSDDAELKPEYFTFNGPGGVEYKIDLSCINKAGWEIKNRLGLPSLYAAIYLACHKEDCNNILKINYNVIYPQSHFKKLEREADLTKLAAELGLGPKVKDVIDCNICEEDDKDCYLTKIIVMEKLEHTYKQSPFTVMQGRGVDKAIYEILTKYLTSDSDIIHSDLHPGNIMLNKIGETKVHGYRTPIPDYKAYIIDWGDAGHEKDPIKRLKYRLQDVSIYTQIHGFVHDNYSDFIRKGVEENDRDMIGLKKIYNIE